ncbi:MAG: TIGR02099 family protein [Xanthomonadaceae bacterium]|nr:TIGR02099 family protein [Xanthomonadaceae bacterium]
MSTPPPRARWRTLWHHTWHALALMLALLALGNGIGSLLLPMVERHPERVAAWLSERANRPVAFDHLQTEWTRRGPLLRVTNLRVGDPTQPLRIGNAEIQIAQFSGLLPGHSFTELRLRGLDLTLQRGDDGQWQVRGLPGQQAGGDPLDALSNLGELQLAQARLRVLAPALKLDLHLPRIDLRLQVNGDQVRAGARAWLEAGATPFAIAGELDRRRGDGRVYVGSRMVDLSVVGNKLPLTGASVLSGRGRLQGWAQLRSYRVVAVRADAGLLDVRLRGAPLPGVSVPVHEVGEWVLAAHWSGRLQDWRLQISRLRMGNGAARQVMDGISVAGGQRFALQAAHLDVAPLLQLAALSNAVPAGLRHWLWTTKPDAVLDDLNLGGQRGGALQASARVSGFRFDPAGHAPGLRGVGGWLQADQDGLRLRFDRNAQVAFDWPAGFGVVHRFTLNGEAVAWRDAAGWTIQTPGLAIDGGPLQVLARGGVGLQDDGSHPHLDIAADIGDVPVSLAHGFWIHHLMPSGTVQWLDAALRGGTLRRVHAIVAGDLDDWPFRSEPGLAGAGMFRADAHIDDGTVKFQPDWPAAEHLNADVSFVADGFTVNGSAQLAGVPVPRLQAGIDRFGKAELRVDAATAGDARQYLALLRASPLHKEHADVMDHLQAIGPAQAQYHMLLPLHLDVPVAPTIDGSVSLAGAKLVETRFQLAFEQVRGEARFDQGGFIAPALQVRLDGAPGVLALRAGPHAQDPAHAFEAQLQMQADIDGLLTRAGTLDWLKPYLRGSSQWTVALAVPVQRGTAAPLPSQLQLHSNLVGTAFNLPEPLHKPAAEPLATSVAIRLPLDSGDIEAILGDVLHLRSRSAHGQTGLRVQMGGGEVAAPPARGLVIGGHVGTLEALDWIGLASSGHGNADMPLQRIDVQAARMRLLGAEFADTRLQVTPGAQGLSVQVQGAAIAGVLRIPDQNGASVIGHFDRLFWALPAVLPGLDAKPADKPGAALAGGAAGNGFNPATIPPLALDVADLRFGSAPLGAARFRSSPMAGGLHLDEFRTVGGKQRMLATGSWTGKAAAAHTQLRLDVDSDDVGSLLNGFGLGGQLAAGKGRLAATASWNGGPEAFDVTLIDASLHADVRDGSLPEVEPGAGRMLGLFGVGQLRRRLTMDFSDIFRKGFAFDRLSGDIQLAQGSARTDNLDIKGPAADLKLHGSVNLRTQRFDQTVEVMPRSGGLLTAVGALAGGPVGAAVGAVANAVLDKPMRNIGARTYRVTGPWSAPKVETITQGEAAAAVPAATDSSN